ncbi:MAG: serpin family protein, partial [Duncaniella sp.]|nr:serpin family protein [Duncaniella sp.]
INNIRQHVHIVVDEHGTEAAAVTDIGLETALPGAPHPEVTIDRPFIFIISESTSSSILFIGRINNL